MEFPKGRIENWQKEKSKRKKGHMDKAKGGQDQGWEVEMAGVGEMGGGKWRQLYLNNNKERERQRKEGII